MLAFPYCDICKHVKFLENGKRACKAYPKGIPLEAKMKAAEGVECAPGIFGEQKPGMPGGKIKPGGGVEKMFRFQEELEKKYGDPNKK